MRLPELPLPLPQTELSTVSSTSANLTSERMVSIAAYAKLGESLGRDRPLFDSVCAICGQLLSSPWPRTKKSHPPGYEKSGLLIRLPQPMERVNITNAALGKIAVRGFLLFIPHHLHLSLIKKEGIFHFSLSILSLLSVFIYLSSLTSHTHQSANRPN
jgi:hypothetical protein